jgi:hypothetical protein
MITKSTTPPTDDDRYMAWVEKYRRAQRSGACDRIIETKPVRSPVIQFKRNRK